ncbi:hypothetical protein FKW44_023761 [Caligus rogercresseyi]|uniref:Uncharacterized protein n=1 Tax=Caligus rogercresseyi TaxID=217165 RepID=A0A7T8JUZ4_CALRO|nr:hypothetical protein FKW44_023761 [Caligus rogercresseyi]
MRVEVPPTRQNSVFIGGAILANIMKDRDDSGSSSRTMRKKESYRIESIL